MARGAHLVKIDGVDSELRYASESQPGYGNLGNSSQGNSTGEENRPFQNFLDWAYVDV